MFKVTKKSIKSNARIGTIQTRHGSISTPCFMPDATRASIRGLTSGDLIRLNLQSMVVNTYHLYLQPGIGCIKKSKGVHRFMNWDGPLVSDSGGYQVFSLVHRNKFHVIADPVIASECTHERGNPVNNTKSGKGGIASSASTLPRNDSKIDNSGVSFRSPYDGSKHRLTPKKSIQIQFDLGTDLIICFDDVPPHNVKKSEMDKSIEHTIAWAGECKKEFELQIKKRKLKKNPPILFGVIQGGIDKDLRKKCADALLEIGFDGYGFGARPVDDEGNFLEDILDYTARLIPDDKIRFNLGMGTPSDIIQSVKMGWDLFDCVIPTREARHGRLYTSNQSTTIIKGRGLKSSAFINIANAKFAKDHSPINTKSKLPELKEYTKAYLHHLFKTKEPLSIRLATLNNLEFYMQLMTEIRCAIRKGKL